ncbi:MAG: NTP transferase domain-containing protein [Anaerolineae bacterium]|nr:NTP transferase domain-containing protein [Anaerolineae bacterium]
MKVGLIPAAGMARRLGISWPKELLDFRGKAIIEYSINNLIDAGVDSIVIVIRTGKEALKEYVEYTFKNRCHFDFVYQQGEIGNLIDAIKASYHAIKGHDVYFCMADTFVRPNPFKVDPVQALTLLCFKAEGNMWKNFGVVDVKQHKVVDKPAHYISDICWGALIWKPSFTEKIMASSSLPDVLNQVNWEYTINIEEYKDIGIKKLPNMDQWKHGSVPPGFHILPAA